MITCQLTYCVKELAGEVARVEGRGDDNVGLGSLGVSHARVMIPQSTHISDVLVEEALSSFLVVTDEVLVTLRLEPWTEAELIHAPQSSERY